MLRPDHVLHEINLVEWTEHEVFSHLSKTFDDACAQFPDVMEPYVVRVAETLGKQETKDLMREALRETFRQRRAPRANNQSNQEAAE
jgi:hypothetical protein